MNPDAKHRRGLIVFFIVNVLMTVVVFAYTYLEVGGWHFECFYGNVGHIEMSRLEQICISGHGLHSRLLLELAIPIIGWFVLTCFLLWGRIPSDNRSESIGRSESDTAIRAK